MVFIDIMMMKETQLQKNYHKFFMVFLLLGMTFISQAQSCVCFQNHFLTDYKEADFIAQVTILEVDKNYRTLDEDRVKFSTTSVFKGEASTPLFIKQAIGNSIDNSRCQLFVKPGDELIIFAQLVCGELVTTPCMRNSFIYKDDPKFHLDNINLLSTLEDLSQFNQQIAETSINCTTLKKDTDVVKQIGKMQLEGEQSHFGLYNVKFDENNDIEFIGVVSPFNKEIDKKIRILLIKKSWDICELNENRELLVGYFYHPSSEYRKGYLSTF